MLHQPGHPFTVTMVRKTLFKTKTKTRTRKTRTMTKTRKTRTRTKKTEE